jgi:chromosome segregation ATPase
LLTDLAITRGDLEALRANQQSRDEGLSRSDANFEALQEKFADLEKNYNELLEIKAATEQDLSAAAGENAENQGAIEALQRERDMLERQLQNLSLSADAGSKEIMREMIVNFTEESRELLLAIEESGKEKAELQQKITDMEKSGKGTAGAVVGLKRRLAEAEAALQELNEVAR